MGECTEKSILVQLAAQRGGASFFINGGLFLEGEVGTHPHAYNIVLRGGLPFLVDAQNPLHVDSGGIVTHPYIVPIIGLEDGNIRVPQEWRQGREYSLT